MTIYLILLTTMGTKVHKETTKVDMSWALLGETLVILVVSCIDQ